MHFSAEGSESRLPLRRLLSLAIKLALVILIVWFAKQIKGSKLLTCPFTRKNLKNTETLGWKRFLERVCIPFPCSEEENLFPHMHLTEGFARSISFQLSKLGLDVHFSEDFISHLLCYCNTGAVKQFAVSFKDPWALGLCTWLQWCIFSIKTFLRKWQQLPNSGS